MTRVVVLKPNGTRAEKQRNIKGRRGNDNAARGSFTGSKKKLMGK